MVLAFMNTSKYFIVYFHFGTTCLFIEWLILNSRIDIFYHFLPHVIVVIMNVILYCFIACFVRNDEIKMFNQNQPQILALVNEFQTKQWLSADQLRANTPHARYHSWTCSQISSCSKFHHLGFWRWWVKAALPARHPDTLVALTFTKLFSHTLK